MFPILADLRLVEFFRSFYYMVGPVGVIFGFALGALVLVFAFSRKGVMSLFFLFLLEGLCTGEAEYTAALFVILRAFRYFLLFPLTLWGIIWMFSKNRRLGSVGVLFLLHTLLFFPSVVYNSGLGWERLVGTIMMWFAIIGTISGQVYDIERLKKFLASLGIWCWFLVLVFAGYAILFPGPSFINGRLTTLLGKANALAIGLFFAIIPMGYRAFIMSPNKFRSIDLLATGIALLMMVMTGTRAAGFGVIPVLFVLLRGRSKSYMLISILMFLIVFGIAWNIPSINYLIQQRYLGTTAPLTTSGRVEFWRAVWPYVLDRPLIGHGMGFLVANQTNAFNSFLLIAIEGGIINALVFIALFFAGIFSGLKGVSRLTAKADKRIAQLILATTFGVAFICFFESIAAGIGGPGMVVVWTFLQLNMSLRPAQEQELYYYDSAEEDYDYYPLEAGEAAPMP
ncbi:MAG: O-antigen ligase family protein [Planctomycetota bacterium]|jgi:hypothetical protein